MTASRLVRADPVHVRFENPEHDFPAVTAYRRSPDGAPGPLELLEATNLITRVIDREGNITDHEIHGSAGGPLNGAGQYGIRRTVIRRPGGGYWERRCCSPVP